MKPTLKKLCFILKKYPYSNEYFVGVVDADAADLAVDGGLDLCLVVEVDDLDVEVPGEHEQQVVGGGVHLVEPREAAQLVLLQALVQHHVAREVQHQLVLLQPHEQPALQQLRALARAPELVQPQRARLLQRLERQRHQVIESRK